MAGKGGTQQPRQPAAVSNPRSGARTDGGAGSKSQPLRVPSGGGYGERKALTEQQQGAPLAASGASPQGMGGQGAGGGGAPSMGGGSDVGGVFGPTQEPNVPSSSPEMNSPRQMAATNPDQFLRVLYSQYPTAAIGALLRRGGTNG